MNSVKNMIKLYSDMNLHICSLGSNHCPSVNLSAWTALHAGEFECQVISLSSIFDDNVVVAIETSLTLCSQSLRRPVTSSYSKVRVLIAFLTL